jgi:hypothetical protein
MATTARARPPFYVRWEDDGHESLVFPGDAVVEHYPEHTPARAGGKA